MDKSKKIFLAFKEEEMKFLHSVLTNKALSSYFESKDLPFKKILAYIFWIGHPKKRIFKSNLREFRGAKIKIFFSIFSK